MRHLHLDVYYDDDAAEFYVQHSERATTINCVRLTNCLSDIHQWQAERPGSPGLMLVLGQAPVLVDGALVNVTSEQWAELDGHNLIPPGSKLFVR